MELVEPTALPQPRPDEQSTAAKLAGARRKLEKVYGEDYDPLLELARIAKALEDEGDLKGAVAPLQAIADRYYPKLKAQEVDNKGGVPPIVLNVVSPQPEEKIVRGDSRLPFER